MPSISERAVGVRDMPERERPISELFRIAGDKYVAARKAFKTVDDTEKVKLARMKQRYIDECHKKDSTAKTTDAAAERYVFMSEEWEEHLLHKIELDADMQLLKIEMDELRMRHEEQRERSANSRKSAIFPGGDSHERDRASSTGPPAVTGPLRACQRVKASCRSSRLRNRCYR